MSKHVEVELIENGIIALLKSPEMMACLTDIATSVKNRAGDGYETSQYTGKKRANVSVIATTEEAVQDNLENNTLLKVLGSYK
jgi:hypothetical protein